MNEKKKTFTIKLQEIDGEHLVRLNNDLESNKSLYYSIRKGGKRQNQWIFEQTSNNMSSRLIELGMCGNKTYKIKFPEHYKNNKEYTKDFIRGMWDANGSFSFNYAFNNAKTKRTKLRLDCSLVSTLDICENVKGFIETETGLSLKIRRVKKNLNEDSVYRLELHSCRNIYNFSKWLYKDANIFLQRKYNKCKEIEDIMISRKIINEHPFFKGV